jgi:hypothetical protein
MFRLETNVGRAKSKVCLFHGRNKVSFVRFTLGESQRDSSVQPRVARNELPWVKVQNESSTLTGLNQIRFRELLRRDEIEFDECRAELTILCCNPFRVDPFVNGSPRVARSSQPWAD